MITSAQRDLIGKHFPGLHPAQSLRRQIVQRLVDAEGELPVTQLAGLLRLSPITLCEAVRQCTGLLLSRCRLASGGATVRLGVGLRETLGLDVLDARAAGYDGPPCPYCHERKTVSSGTLHVCDACGRRWRSESFDPLARERALVARAKNVATVEEALCHAGLDGIVRIVH